MNGTQLEQQAAAVMSIAADRAGFGEPHWPLYDGAVLAMMESLDYQCDRRLMFELAESVIPVPVDADGKRRWTATNAVDLVAQLESRRRWKCTPTHWHKMSLPERLQHQAEQCGASTCINDLDRFDAESLLVLMTEQDNRHVREVLRVALITKLQQAGAL